jgi:hypothetical protein
VGFVLTPAMYALIDPKLFDLGKLNLPNTSDVPKFPSMLAADGTAVIPFTQEQMLNSLTGMGSHHYPLSTIAWLYRSFLPIFFCSQSLIAC